MSVKGSLKEAAGFIKEEMYEHGTTAEAKQKAEEGRAMRNEGRVEAGKKPLVQPPGTGSTEAEEDK